MFHMRPTLGIRNRFRRHGNRRRIAKTEKEGSLREISPTRRYNSLSALRINMVNLENVY